MKQLPANAAPIPLAAPRRTTALVGDYVALTKPRLNFLVVATSAAGYYLGAASPIEPGAMIVAVAGTALVAGGAAVLNQLYERDTDALMRRTRMRPLPAGRVVPADAGLFGAALSILGLALLAARANWLSASLAFTTLLVYLAVYTPMKRRTPAATLVGAVPGALPALIGWTASHGSVAVGGAALFAIVFLWQIPHFMAIAWLYRDDYGKAGFPLLPVIEPNGVRAGRHAVAYAAALLPVALVPTLAGLAGIVYLVSSALLGVAFLALAARFWLQRTDAAARWLFFGSIVYLPLIWIVLVADKI
jgi:heme o synthase